MEVFFFFNFGFLLLLLFCFHAITITLVLDSFLGLLLPYRWHQNKRKGSLGVKVKSPWIRDNERSAVQWAITCFRSILSFKCYLSHLLNKDATSQIHHFTLYIQHVNMANVYFFLMFFFTKHYFQSILHIYVGISERK